MSKPTARLLMTLIMMAATPAVAQPLYQHLRIVAPAAPGGGWDQTARVIQRVLQDIGIVHTSSVENIPGAAGTIGLARFASSERGNGDTTMMSGLIMLAAIVTHRSAVTLHDVTPIARLIGEYEVIVVPAASPIQSMSDLVRRFKEHPEAISWGGGSAGGTDQILAGLVADAVGVPPRRVNYIAFSGGGESMSAILGGQVSVGINGLAEFAPQIEAGAVRALAISSAERLPLLNVPTLREQGIDVELENWRSLVAPPGVSSADRRRLEAAVDAMVHSAPWREALTRYRWNDRYLVGDAFASFIDSEEARVRAILSKLETGTTNGMSLGLYPILVGAGLGLSVASFTFGLVRSPKARISMEAPSTAWKGMSIIAAGIVLDVLLLERAGFLIASTMLFWLTARAFDAQHPVRDACYAVGLSALAYGVFAHLLQLSLPAGVLAGWI